MRRLAFFLICLGALSSSASAEDAEKIARGKAVAVAADCAGCHSNPDGSSEYSGGLALEAPMGTIYAPNITPDAETGIGGWSEKEFTRAIRDGVSPRLGTLYPAMPFTNYHGMSDDDVSALYAYMMNAVEPVSNIAPKTDLGWPFWRPFVRVWSLFLVHHDNNDGHAAPSGSAERGRYLADVLGHCTACHSRRGMAYEIEPDHKYSGEIIGGWHAPNITPDETGIGGWTDDELFTYLKTGYSSRRIAGGHMGEAVRLSLSRMPDDDIRAIVSYLRTVPPIRTEPYAPRLESAPPVDVGAVDIPLDGWKGYAEHDTLDGAQLYLGACATCHGLNGDMDPATMRPSMLDSRTVRSVHPDNLVQVIAHGNQPHGVGGRAPMPGFINALSHDQIAAVGNYVRSRFAGIDQEITGDDVAQILSGHKGAPFLIKHAFLISIIAPIVGLILLALIVSFFVGRRKRAN